MFVSLVFSSATSLCCPLTWWGGGGEGGTPIYGLYGDVPMDRVWFLVSVPSTWYIILGESILNRV